MKLNKLWASALALLALASCSKDLEPSANLVEPAAEYQLVRMDIKATQDDNALRVGYGVSDDESGVLTGLALADKNVNIRIAVKQGLNGTPVVDTYPFTKIGRASFAFSDKIKIPVKSGDEPYYMAAVLLSEGTKNTPDYLEYTMLDEDNHPTRVYFPYQMNAKLLQPDAENKIYPNIPYRSQWQQVEMNAVGAEGKVANHTTIKLKPLGTLLRFRIHNMTTSSKKVRDVMFISPTFSNRGEMDFQRTDADNFPMWRTTYATPELTYGLSGLPITIEPDQKSNWYYMWVKSYTYSNDVRPEPVVVRYRIERGGEFFAPIFKTRKLLRDGSMSVTFKIRDGVDAELEDLDDAGDLETADVLYDWPGTVLRRLSTGVVNTTENGFVSGHDVRDASVGYFTFEDALQKFKTPVKIAVGGVKKKYSLPTANEMKSIFPSAAEPITSLPVRFGVNQTLKNVLEQNITINGETKDFKADYKTVASKKVTYAIRFKDLSNKHRTAFKYTLEGDEASDIFVKVRARLLSNKSEFASVTLEQLEQDSFWNDPMGIYDERIFPFYGSKNLRDVDPDYAYNKTGTFWASSSFSSDFAYSLYCSIGGRGGAYGRQAPLAVSAPDGIRDIPVFLFERK